MQQRIYLPDQEPSFLARWTSRLAIFCAVLLVVIVFLHRVLSLPTPIALNVAIAVFAGAVVVLVMAAVAGLDIWMTGRQGASRIVVGAGVALLLLTIPAGIYLASRQWPELNDVSTDLVDPPEFRSIANVRPAGTNPLDYPVDKFADMQRKSYPDLRTVSVPRSVSDSFETVLQAVAKLRHKVEFETAPDLESGDPGTIELIDRTLWLGFADDIVIRVSGDEQSSEIDVRSASRYGRNDFGRNAARTRELLREIVGRLEATLPAPPVAKKEPDEPVAKPVKKRRKARDPGSKAGRSRPNSAQSNARRAPAPIASPLE